MRGSRNMAEQNVYFEFVNALETMILQLDLERNFVLIRKYGTQIKLQKSKRFKLGAKFETTESTLT